MDDQFEPILNEAVYPTLSLNKYYLKILKCTEDLQVRQYLLGKVKDAVWLRKTVQRRMDTLLKVAQTIVQIQQQFFIKGPKYLVSMNLSDIAQKLSLHESRVSRAVHDKYLECSRGVYQLKYFFSSKADSERSGCSRQAIKAEIMEIIGSEDKSRPYSDSQLVELLGQSQIPLLEER
jgi:RNA polymerase sigma-54 factor